jgi:DNA helicase II / ATP-dependent DNA helicase PcrA
MTQLTISYAETRFRYGQFSLCEPSRFIDELAPEFVLNTSTQQRFKKPNPAKESFAESRQNFAKTNGNLTGEKAIPTEQEQESMFVSMKAEDLKPGLVVQHQRFGMGKVEEIEGTGENAKATVNFSNFGKKQLLLKFAKLKILS